MDHQRLGHFDQTGHRAFTAQALALRATSSASVAKATSRSCLGSSALPNAKVDSHKATARAMEPTSFGAARCTSDRCCLRSGRQTAAPWSDIAQIVADLGHRPAQLCEGVPSAAASPSAGSALRAWLLRHRATPAPRQLGRSPAGHLRVPRHRRCIWLITRRIGNTINRCTARNRKTPSPGNQGRQQQDPPAIIQHRIAHRRRVHGDFDQQPGGLHRIADHPMI